MTALYVPPTGETDQKKQNQSLQLIGGVTSTNTTNITTNTAAIAALNSGLYPGTTTNDSATAGNIGELLSAGPTTQALTNTTSANVTSISLTAGDWELSGFIQFSGAGATVTTDLQGSLGPTTGTLTTTVGQYARWRGSTTDLFFPMPVGPLRVSLSGTTIYYLVAQAAFTVSTYSSAGVLHARRAR